MMPLMNSVFLALLILVGQPTISAAGPTLDLVRANGKVRCGVGEGLPGFSYKARDGRWQGFGVDFCRAVAAAALGKPDKVEFVPLTTANRFPMLLSGKIDLLLRSTTCTFEREAALKVHFPGIFYYDGQGFLVPKSSGIRKLADLEGASICLGKSTTHEGNLEDYFSQRGWSYKPQAFDSLPEMMAAFFTGQCQALTSDLSQLAAIRLKAPDGPDNYVILPETISKEPLGPVVRWGDEEWLTLVKWVLFALIEAEERGVTQENVHTLQKSSPYLATRRFLTSDGLAEKALGLKPGWVVRVIEAVGNFGEIFERHLGSQSELKLDRGFNRLWTQGGLMYAPPFR